MVEFTSKKTKGPMASALLAFLAFLMAAAKLLAFCDGRFRGIWVCIILEAEDT